MLRPQKKTVKRLVLQKQTKSETQVRYEMKTVKEKKTVIRKEKQTQTRINMVKKMENRPEM